MVPEGHISDMGTDSTETVMANAFLLNARNELFNALHLPNGRLTIENYETINVQTLKRGDGVLKEAVRLNALTADEASVFMCQMKDANIPKDLAAVYQAAKDFSLPAGFKAIYVYQRCPCDKKEQEHGTIRSLHDASLCTDVISKESFLEMINKRVDHMMFESNAAIQLLREVGNTNIPEVADKPQKVVRFDRFLDGLYGIIG